jgi:hypothetical protein
MIRASWKQSNVCPTPEGIGMKPFTQDNWHVWQSMNGADNPFMLSDEDNKKLLSFKTADDVINWLYLAGFKETARALNAHVKGSK